MDILVTSINKVFFKIDSQIGALLCAAFPEAFKKAGDSEPLPAQADERKALRGLGTQLMGSDAPVPHVAAPQWGIVDLPSGYPAIRFAFRNETLHYDGTPENANKAFQQEIPAEVLAAYKKAWRPRK